MPILGKFGDLEEEDNLEVSHVSSLINCRNICVFSPHHDKNSEILKRFLSIMYGECYYDSFVHSWLPAFAQLEIFSTFVERNQVTWKDKHGRNLRFDRERVLDVASSTIAILRAVRIGHTID